MTQFRAGQIRSRIDLKQREQASKETELAEFRRQRKEKRDEQHKIQQIKATVDNMRFKLGQKERELAHLEKNRVRPEEAKEAFSIQVKVSHYYILLVLVLLIKGHNLIMFYVVEKCLLFVFFLLFVYVFTILITL